MAIPPTAIKFAGPIDPQEVLDYVFPMTPVLEAGEQIDPADWSLILLAEAVALGLEIIEGDPEFPDPALTEGNTAIRAWFRIDQGFAGNAAFQGAGISLPMAVTLETTSSPSRTRQRTFLMTVAEQ